MAHEIVKIHNDLTNEKLGKMNAKELDLFMTICHKMRNKGTEQVVITFDELRKLSNYNKNSNADLKAELIKANSKLLEFQIVVDIGAETVQRALFKEFRTNVTVGHLSVEMWEETAYILNDLVSHFTRFELSEFISLESKYAKKLYKIIKQYKTQGKFYISKDNLYKALDIPKSLHRACNFNDRALSPALKECGKYIPNLKCIPKKGGRGGAIKGYNFTFAAEIPPKKQTKNKNKFNDFEKQNYDINELEQQLLSN